MLYSIYSSTYISILFWIFGICSENILYLVTILLMS